VRSGLIDDHEHPLSKVIYSIWQHSSVERLRALEELVRNNGGDLIHDAT